jgi:hypothetical protein
MKQFLKDIRGEIRKRVIEKIVALLGWLLLALSATATWWGARLSLSDSQISSIRYWLIFVGFVALVSVAWILFLYTFRKLRLVEQQLIDAQKRPHRFQDECIFDKRLGLYRHKTKPELFCGTCTTQWQSLESPLKEMAHGWQCLVDSKHWHPNPDYQNSPTIPMKVPGWLGPEDF